MLCVVMMNVQLYITAEPNPPKNQLQNIPNHVVKLAGIPGLVKPTVITLWSDRLCLIFTCLLCHNMEANLQLFQTLYLMEVGQKASEHFTITPQY